MIPNLNNSQPPGYAGTTLIKQVSYKATWEFVPDRFILKTIFTTLLILVN